MKRTEPTRTERGATAVEYALMVAFIASVIALAVTALGVKLLPIFVDATTWF